MHGKQQSLRNNDKGQLEACKDKDICTTGKHGAIKPRKISLPSHTHITFKSQSPQVTKIDLTLGSKRPSFAIHSSTLWKEGKKRGWVLQRQAEPQQLNSDKLLAIKREENCDLIQPLPLSLLSLLAISTTARLDLWRFLIGDIRQPEERWSYQTPQLCLWRDESCAVLTGRYSCAVTGISPLPVPKRLIGNITCVPSSEEKRQVHWDGMPLPQHCSRTLIHTEPGEYGNGEKMEGLGTHKRCVAVTSKARRPLPLQAESLFSSYSSEEVLTQDSVDLKCYAWSASHRKDVRSPLQKRAKLI